MCVCGDREREGRGGGGGREEGEREYRWIVWEIGLKSREFSRSFFFC